MPLREIILQFYDNRKHTARSMETDLIIQKSTAVTIRNQFNIKQFYCSANIVYLCVLSGSEKKTAIISLYSIN